ncbi:hypothetical protein JTB14_011271 [Gonioctena quinquepunctata]|nr:hypothetical protein JTB14_011271 [Gonioctena quinquepunctata]
MSRTFTLSGQSSILRDISYLPIELAGFLLIQLNPQYNRWFFGIPQEEIPTNSDEDLPLAGNDDDSDSTIIINMDEHMQRMEVDYIETPASPVSEDFFGPASIFRNGHQHPFHHRICSRRSLMMERCPIGCLLQK